VQEAINAVENNGIVFLDESTRSASARPQRGDVSREGVQRELLPLDRGHTVSTKHGAVKTIISLHRSGAFHIASRRPVAGIAGGCRSASNCRRSPATTCAAS